MLICRCVRRALAVCSLRTGACVSEHTGVCVSKHVLVCASFAGVCLTRWHIVAH